MKRLLLISAAVLLLFPLLIYGGVFGVAHLAHKAHSYGYYAVSLWVYKRLAQLGIDEYEKQIGRMYIKGQGVPKDYKEAARWYRNPAENGDTKAQAILGFLYMSDLLVVQDLEKSFDWFSRAANAGDRFSQATLAYYYTHGHGVLADKVQAYKWYLIRFDGNIPNTYAKKLKEDGVEFTPTEIAEAQPLAREWMENFRNTQ